MESDPREARPLEVTLHACQRYVQRDRRLLDSREIDFEAIRDEISDLVRSAVKAGRTASRKPKAFRLHGTKNVSTPLPPGQRIVWTKGMRAGFIVVSEPDKDIMTTALSPTVRSR